MGSFKVYATVAGLLVAAASTSARAADLLPPPPPLPVPVEVGGGWYLRGDVGVSAYDAGKIQNGVGPNVVNYDQEFGAGAFAGAGAGYQFNNWFRADITGEYRFSNGFSWRDRGPVGTSTIFYNPGTDVYDTYTANGTSYERSSTKYSSAVVLVNGYFDLGTWYGITPFVGAGVGWAYHWFEGGNTTTVNAFGNFIGPDGTPSVGTAPSSVGGGALRNSDKGDMAWALHAGLAYDINPNLKLELAYRYLNMGSVKTGPFDCFCGGTYGAVKIKDLESQDIKIGMRWMLGGPVAAPLPAEPYGAPIIRKY